MMKFKNILFAATLAGITLVASSQLVQAQVCPPAEVAPPSKQSRVFRHERLNYRFSIPQNYRTMTLRSNGILIYDPNTFVTAQCFLKNKLPTELPDSISVYVSPVTSRNRSLVDLVKQGNPTVENLQNTTVANQKAVSYISSTLGQQKNVSFLTPDRRSLITVSAPFNFEQGRPTTVFNQEVFNRVLSTFAFVRK